jgi:N-methylhydantoinase B
MRRSELDVVTLEIIRNRLEVIADSMQHTLLRSAVSVILKEGEDGSSGLFRPNGDTIAQACACPIHLTVMPEAIRAITAWFPPDQMLSDDAYIVNDPYNGGTHLPDILMAVPVLVDGRVAAFSVALGHQEDIGGIDPGSMSANGRELYQEGLVIPPSPWMREGRHVETTRNFIRYNVRLPDTVLGDLEAEYAACALGARQYAELAADYGHDMLAAAIDRLFDQAEERVRKGVGRIADGRYEFVDWAENHRADGPRLPVRCIVEIAGTEVHVDFAGTAPQQDGPINVNLAGATSGVHTILRGLTDADAPLNEGAVRPITVTAPEACLMNAQRPAAIALRAQVSQRAADCVLGALSLAPEAPPIAASHGGNHVISFGGQNFDGTPYGSTDLTAGGLGARIDQDGVDHIEYGFSNCQTPTAESWEAHYPIMVVEDTPIRDSGGAGLYRGGLGVRRAFKILHGRVTSCHRAERFSSSPWGVCGGLPGRTARAYVIRVTGRREPIHAQQVVILEQGDTVVLETAGGGGYGDPWIRDPETVRADVLDRKVSVDAAHDVYGVIMTEDAVVDEEETRRWRARLSSARGPITWRLDRGADGRLGLG